MITNSEKPTAMMPGLKKAAILIVALGEETGDSPRKGTRRFLR